MRNISRLETIAKEEAFIKAKALRELKLLTVEEDSGDDLREAGTLYYLELDLAGELFDGVQLFIDLEADRVQGFEGVKARFLTGEGSDITDDFVSALDTHYLDEDDIAGLLAHEIIEFGVS